MQTEMVGLVGRVLHGVPKGLGSGKAWAVVVQRGCWHVTVLVQYSWGGCGHIPLRDCT